MKEEQVRAIFLLAGIPMTGLYEIVNQYWPDHENYDEVRKANPWWLVKTEQGLIRIGWRKRVISIDWSDLPIRVVREDAVTRDNVTRDAEGMHAYSYGKAIDYLADFWRIFEYSLLPDLTDERLTEVHGVQRVPKVTT